MYSVDEMVSEPDGEVQKLCAAAAAVTDVSSHHQRAYVGRRADL